MDQETARVFQLLKNQVATCEKCRLFTTRHLTVFGEGDPESDIMFIGEGPGQREDQTGRPFVGRAGELLTKIIEAGMGIPRSSVYIANIVKCRPTVDQKMVKDRAPMPDEVAACLPYLREQIRLIEPKVIITLGAPAAKTILNKNIAITKERGNWGKIFEIPVMPTYHPSYLLRNGGDSSPQKKEVWQDIKAVLKFLNMPIPQKKNQ